MAAHGTSAKSLLLKMYKDGVRHLRGDADSSLSYYGLQTNIDPGRAMRRLHTVLLESDVRAAWHDGKQRAKQQLRNAYAAVTGPGNTVASEASANAQTEEHLKPLYGADGLIRDTMMYLLAHASRSFMQGLNTTQVEGAHHMQTALARPKGQALITVCNHVASMDDPLVMSTILPTEAFSNASSLRWTLCATDRCFRSQLLTPFFRSAKVLPVERGAGMFQPGLAAAEARLAAGDWVHIFPEGTRSSDGSMRPVRKGVGRLIAACSEPPMIIPFVHSGMEKVMPRGAIVPKMGKEVRVVVGEPIDVSDLLAAQHQLGWTEDDLYCRIANRIGRQLHVMKARLDGVEVDTVMLQEQQAQVFARGLDLYDPVDNIGRQSMWERIKFKMQHREWATRGLSAAAADMLDQCSTRRSSGGREAPTTAVAAGMAGGAVSGAGDCLAPNLLEQQQVVARRHANSYQRSVAMMQLLQARV